MKLNQPYIGKDYSSEAFALSLGTKKGFVSATQSSNMESILLPQKRNDSDSRTFPMLKFVS